jgi:transcription elongation factor GreB
MSRAFVKEDGPEDPSLPDLPVSPGPNLVTPRGLQQLQARLVAAQEELTRLRARPDRLDLMPEAAAARDIRYFEARLRSAVVMQAPQAPTEVKFGCRVTLEDALGRTRTWVLVGEDEADSKAGLLSFRAPLAMALMGLAVGDDAQWGAGTVTILAIGPA